MSFKILALAVAVAAVGAAAPCAAQVKGAVKGSSYLEFVRAYEKGDTGAAFDAGFAFFHGMSGAAQDYGRAMEWYRKAADKGHPVAARHLGDMYYHGTGVTVNYAEALKWYAKAADGDAEAAERLGDLYAGGLGVKKSCLEAEKYYLKAAAALGGRGLAFKLGRLYYKGEAGLKQNHPEALKWFEQAFQAGEPGAAAYLADIHTMGLGVKKNLPKAGEWLVKGSVAGDTVSMFKLGEAYANGLGVRRDNVEAYKWFATAAAKENNPMAEKLQAAVGKRLSARETAAAQKGAEEYIAKYVTPQDRADKAFLKTLKGD